MKQIRSSSFPSLDPDNDDLVNYMETFFLKYFPDPSVPLGLVCGLSGGSDSTALLYLMKELATRRLLDLTFVHVDHRWRKESSDQAKALEARCNHLGLRFECCNLSNDRVFNNLEAHGRQERLRIFTDSAIEHRAAAVVLGHHFDDCVESMLKKIFEGAELSQLKAMTCDTQIGKARILRPFLSLDKDFLKKWLRIRNIDHFEDPTNSDAKFWRGFVRSKLLNSVEGALGKEISSPLKRLCRFSRELAELLDSCVEKKSPSIHWGIDGMWSEVPQGSELLLRHFLRKRAEAFGTHIPYRSIEALVGAIKEHKINYSIQFGLCKALIWRNLIFFKSLKSRAPNPKTLLIDQPGDYRIGTWRVRAQRSTSSPRIVGANRDWRTIWRGEFTAVIAKDQLLLTMPKPGLKMRGRKTTLATYWNKKRVPPPLRTCVPVVIENGQVAYQWLSEYPYSAAGQDLRTDLNICWILHFTACNGANP